MVPEVLCGTPGWGLLGVGQQWADLQALTERQEKPEGTGVWAQSTVAGMCFQNSIWGLEPPPPQQWPRRLGQDLQEVWVSGVQLARAESVTPH